MSATARLVTVSIALVLGAAALLAGADEPDASLRYAVSYDARIVPTQRAVRVTMRLDEGARWIRWIRFRIDPERHLDFAGDGDVRVEGERVEWSPPAGGGSLHYVFRIDRLRDELSYDARCAEDWAIFRGDDLVPPARVRAESGAESVARLRFRLPQGWSVVAPYDRSSNGSFRIDHPERRFDRPVGWIVVGHLGVRRERIAGSRLAVAGPVGHGLRRLDLLALLRWTLPSLRDVLGTLPDRLVVVGAGDPMWRGGLSGPRSVFVHADRPLIEGDGTSPVLHELVHAVLRARAGPGGDWIVEGLAEYYSLQLLVRSKTISRRRHEKSLAKLADKGRSVRRLQTDRSSGAITARAVGVLAELDGEIRAATDDRRSLDDVVRELARERQAMTTDLLRQTVGRVTGSDLASFFDRREFAARARPAASPAADSGVREE